MLYHLLYPLAGRFAIFNVFRYPSFRIVAAFIFSLLLGMIIGPYVIERLRRRQHGQSNVREDTPETHKKKAGTPTMGGGLILLCTLLGTMLLADLTNRYVWTVVLVFAGFGGIGFLDDYLKLSKRNSKGLRGKLKLLFQTLVLAGAFAINLDPSKGWRWPFAIDPHLTLPFVATNTFNWELGWLYLPFAWIVIVGTSNAVNLTDGLDGLAIGPSIVSSSTFTVLAYIAGAALLVPVGGKLVYLADYLYVPHIPAAVELAVFAASLAGAGIAFLWYNTYPASVFMGDLGSLAIGGALGTMAMLTKNEIASAILHGVFLVEALSVMIQVFWFKRTGKRVFLRAPIHHHYELAGWAEPKIIVRFWIMSILLAGVALASLKLR
ncbi:MAG TPA: phospho-N-acetylmuramoyl-pentapeptide-transferase [Myxococcales bacterium]|jgi:phospho-N-acetylmuramoyl-pentapeptide-transferase|nr:phospho-N-acetylmuramoyl-pentapeptide-transferase [Myxococcales bacterium]